MTLRNAAEQGSPKAQDLLGIAYERDAGIKQSYAEALRFSSKLRFLRKAQSFSVICITDIRSSLFILIDRVYELMNR
jgi:hypothetical protein